MAPIYRGMVLFGLRRRSFAIGGRNPIFEAVDEMLEVYRPRGIPAFEFEQLRYHRAQEADSYDACERATERAMRAERE